MANVLSVNNGGSVLFPPQLMKETIDLVRGKSSLAKLSGAMPVSFNGNTVFTFNLDKEVDFVDENGAKSNGGGNRTGGGASAARLRRPPPAGRQPWARFGRHD